MQKIHMLRVNKECRCPVCGKPDWCLIAEDESAAICARIEQGSFKRAGEAGYLHLLRTDAKSRKPVGRRNNNRRSALQQRSKQAVINRRPTDFAKMAEVFASRCSDWQMWFLSNILGVTPHSLRRLGVGCSGGGFTFPMSDEHGHIIGIRRRFDNGNKNSVTGSKNGLFIPAGIENAPKLVICEGPTDCAAALDLGYDAIGRPSCNSKVAMTVRYVQKRPVIIVADRDTAGIRGAQKLTDALLQSGSDVRIVLPPPAYKDLRQWKESGARINL